MPTRVQHKRSSVAANVPASGDLQVGEIAINFADKYIYTKNGASAIIRLTGAFPLAEPANQTAGDSYLDPATGKIYAYYNLNGGGEAWRELAPAENLSGYLLRDGSQPMTGALTLAGGAVTGDQAMSFTQTSAAIAGVVAFYVKADGTIPMTGALTLPGDPTLDLHAATKGYVDDAVDIATPDLSAFLPKSGGVMTGQITLPGGGTGNQAATANELASAVAAHVALSDPHAQYADLTDLQLLLSSHALLTAGTVDAIELTFSTPYTAYVAKMLFRFTATGANTITNPTVNVDTLGAKTIKKLNGSALAIGDIGGVGHVCLCVYNGTDVLLLNPALAPDRAHTFTTKQTYNGPVVRGQTILTDAATIAWDLSVGGPNYKVTITSNRTLGAFTNSTDGQEGFLTVVQDATGGRALDLSNAVYDFFGGFVQNVAAGANDETVYHYRVVSSSSMILQRLGATTIAEGGRDLLSAQTASNSATINFVLTKWLSLYDRFEIDLEDILPLEDADELRFRTSTNGGSSYDSGGSDYATYIHRVLLGAAVEVTIDSAQDYISITDVRGMSNTVGESGCGRLTVHNPAASAQCKISFRFDYVSDNAAEDYVISYGGGRRKAAASVNAIRFYMSDNDIASGTFRLYGVRK